jgi:hypothetical protein
MARIFVSYSRIDGDFARKLARSLSGLGGDIWIDVEDIPAGMNWSSAIQQGLQLCDVMIVILSPDSAASRNVEEEWQYYRDKGKPIIPVLLQPAEVHYQLSRIQYIDFHAQDYETALQQLHTQLRHKGAVLNPISVSEKSVPIPEQKPLTVRAARQRRYWVIGAAVAATMLLIAIIQAALSNGGQEGQPTPTITATTQEAAQVVTTNDPQTDTTQIPTDIPTATDTPIPALILTHQANDATTTHNAGQTATAESWTDTPTATYTPSDTPTATDTPIPLGFPGKPVTRNGDWTPVIQDFGGVSMVLVPVGCFMMGSQDGNPDERDGERECFNEPFWIDLTEVTSGQYGSERYYSGNNRPRVLVTWLDARNFCENVRGARLPTEAEWEYAARGPDSLIYPWGNDFNVGEDDNSPVDYVVYNPNSDAEPAEVSTGSRLEGASWVGALDMSGNVWEWTSTIYRDYPYNPDDGRENDSDDSSTRRVLRGGSWISRENDLRAATRNKAAPGESDYDVGFRCARAE